MDEQELWYDPFPSQGAAEGQASTKSTCRDDRHPTLFFTSSGITSVRSSYARAPESEVPLQPDLRLADLVSQQKVGPAGFSHLRIKYSDKGICSVLAALKSSF